MAGAFTANELRKSIHIKLLTSTHIALRIQSFRLKLSVQEMLEEFAQRIVVEDPDIMELLADLSKRKRDKEFKRITNIDADTIYDMIDGS
jgi:hypothetical protein